MMSKRLILIQPWRVDICGTIVVRRPAGANHQLRSPWLSARLFPPWCIACIRMRKTLMLRGGAAEQTFEIVFMEATSAAAAATAAFAAAVTACIDGNLSLILAASRNA
eukprot:755095-Hanusia_phi.AAC.1